jgi:serine phosphatase RsbU (regulator of sigma subunit)
VSLAVLAMVLGLAFLSVLVYGRAARTSPRPHEEPENSHPGRVVPPGTPVAQTLSASPEDLQELALFRKGLAPEAAKIRMEKPSLTNHDPKELLRQLLNQDTPAGRAVSDAPRRAIEQVERVIGRHVIETLFSLQTQQIPGIDVVSMYRPSQKGSTAFFEIFPIDPGRHGILIAELPGNELPVALLLVQAQALLKAEAPRASSPSETLARVNRGLYRSMPRGMFVTAFFAVLSVKDSTLACASAGCGPLAFWKKASDALSLVNPSGIALGLEEGDLFEKTLSEERVRFAEGDRFTLFSSGVTKLLNDRGEAYGEPRLLSKIKEGANLSSAELMRLLNADLDRHCGAKGAEHGLAIVTGRAWTGV